MAVPTIGTGKPRRTKRSRITPKKLPRALLKKKNHFIGELGGNLVLFHELRDKTRILYFFKKRVKVKPVWPFDDIVEKAVRKRWAPNAVNSMKLALQTARRRFPPKRR